LPGIRQVLRSRLPPEKSSVRGGADMVFTTDEILSLPNLPGVGSFFVQTRHLDIPAGFRTTWKTRALVP